MHSFYVVIDAFRCSRFKIEIMRKLFAPQGLHSSRYFPSFSGSCDQRNLELVLELQVVCTNYKSSVSFTSIGRRCGSSSSEYLLDAIFVWQNAIRYGIVFINLSNFLEEVNVCSSKVIFFVENCISAHIKFITQSPDQPKTPIAIRIYLRCMHCKYERIPFSFNRHALLYYN